MSPAAASSSVISKLNEIEKELDVAKRIQLFHLARRLSCFR